MATTSIGATGVVFPDSTTQATAANPNVVTTIYTSPATWTKPSTLKGIKVTLISGGGSGGRRASSAEAASGGGGGGGGVGYFPAPSIPGPVAVTIGSGGTAPGSNGPGVTGGTSSFGALISATGGGGGVFGATANGGAGGSITSSSTVIGAPGQPGFIAPTNTNSSGGDPWGGWGFAGQVGSTTIGINGIGYGSGGAGNNSAAPGVGKAGFVIVEEFY